MGIYIKGIKKPDRCEACYCSTRDNRYFDVICDLLHRTVAINDRNYEEPTIPPKDCPLVEVKEPHGRLIDADVTQDRLLNIMCGTGYQSRAISAVIYEYITPTVIESEE